MFLLKIRRITIIAFVALSILLSATNLFNLIQNRKTAPDDISKWESHLQPVKQKIPANITTLGYLADEDLHQGAITNGEVVEFFLTQYTLSPLIIRRGSQYSAWIIGNFSNKDFESWLKTVVGAYVMEDMGFGIYLIHRVKK